MDYKLNSALMDNNLIHIVSLNKLQADLMCQYLGKKTGIETTSGFELDSLFLTSQKNSHRKLLGLLDFQNTNMSKVYSILQTGKNKYDIAVFNALPNNTIEMDVLNKGIKGLFYQNDSLEVLSKGLQAILNGEFWFSRKILGEYLAQTTSQTHSLGTEKNTLTSREKEILVMISSGASNKEIADILTVSQNTVRNHIYKTYKKIGAQNRLEAMRWAAKKMWF